MSLHRTPMSAEEIEVRISELLVATADAADPLVDDAVPELLRLLRERLRMDVVFVSEFVEGRRVFRFVDAAAPAAPIAAGDSNPLEETFCKQIVEGRLPERIPDVAALPPDAGLPKLPFRIGAHLSTPIVLDDGRTYGTLCCFSSSPNEGLQARDLMQLRSCALLVARRVEQARRQREREVDALSLLPIDPRRPGA